MLKSIYRSLKAVLTQPKVLVPLFLVSIAMQLAFIYLIVSLTESLIDVIGEQLLTIQNIASYMIVWFSSFPGEILTLIIFFLLVIIIGIYMSFFYAKIALQLSKEEKTSLHKAFNESNKNISNIISVFILFCVVFLVLITIVGVFFSLIDGTGIFEIITLISTIFLFLTIILASFTIPAMAIEDVKPKEALKKAYNFISKNFLQAIAFLVLISIIVLIVDFILTEIASQIFLVLSETNLMYVSLVILTTIISVITSIIYLLGIPFFYLEKK